MTEIVYGAAPVRDVEPVLPKWWRTIDKMSMSFILILFTIGILLGLAASPPLAAKNGFEPFHYVTRQAVFGGAALMAMLLTSMMTPVLVRRLAVVGFALAFVALALLPVFGTDFGKGAVRWYSLGFAAVQPSEFLKPGFVVAAAWMLAANQEINGPPGRLWSFLLMIIIVGFLAAQPDFGQASPRTSTPVRPPNTRCHELITTKLVFSVDEKQSSLNAKCEICFFAVCGSVGRSTTK